MEQPPAADAKLRESAQRYANVLLPSSLEPEVLVTFQYDTNKTGWPQRTKPHATGKTCKLSRRNGASLCIGLPWRPQMAVRTPLSRACKLASLPAGGPRLREREPGIPTHSKGATRYEGIASLHVRCSVAKLRLGDIQPEHATSTHTGLFFVKVLMQLLSMEAKTKPYILEAVSQCDCEWNGPFALAFYALDKHESTSGHTAGHQTPATALCPIAQIWGLQNRETERPRLNQIN